MIIVQEGTTVFETLRKCLAEGTPCVLCTVVESDGSTPADPGSKMAVLPDGSITGTVGGRHRGIPGSSKGPEAAFGGPQNASYGY